MIMILILNNKKKNNNWKIKELKQQQLYKKNIDYIKVNNL